jgi:hypothetical protein
MFIGHFALGFAAKRVAPRLSLAVLFAAAQLADLLWPVLVALGIEHVEIAPGNTAFTPLDFVSYPYSHSLLFLVIWGVLLGVVCRSVVRERFVFALIVALVVSHWVLDVATHGPDMPVYPGGPKIGFGLWNSILATVLIEGALFAWGVWMYLRTTRPKDAVGRWSLGGLLLFLVVAYVGAAAGGPPPSVRVVWITSIIGAGLIVLWSWWLDRHRAPREAILTARTR